MGIWWGFRKTGKGMLGDSESGGGWREREERCDYSMNDHGGGGGSAGVVYDRLEPT